MRFNIHLPYHLAVTLLSIYPRKRETYFTQKSIQMFTVPLSLINHNWKQPKCPSTCEQIKFSSISTQSVTTQQEKCTIEIHNTDEPQIHEAK